MQRIPTPAHGAQQQRRQPPDLPAGGVRAVWLSHAAPAGGCMWVGTLARTCKAAPGRYWWPDSWCSLKLGNSGLLTHHTRSDKTGVFSLGHGYQCAYVDVDSF
jgi:hypothetical protein